MSLKWPPKDEGETRAYGVNWGPLLGTDTILTSNLVIVTGNALINSQTHDDTTMSCIISGGTNGSWTWFTNTITTAGGFTYEQSICLLIESSACIAANPSTSSKSDIIQMAFEEAGQPGYEFDATPEEVISNLRKLDALMAEWKADGIDLNYNFPAVFGQGDLNDPSGIPDASINGVAAWLGFRYMPTQGKVAGAATIGALAMAKSSIRAQTLKIPTMRIPSWTPRGIGNKPWSTYYPFIFDDGCCVPCEAC